MKQIHANVVVTCTARKTENATAQLRVKNLTGKTIKTRFKQWKNRIESDQKKPIKAINLYAGNSWSFVRKMYQNSSYGTHLRFWIISAGQGLITPQTPIIPYQATFSNRHADSVKDDSDERGTTEEWWSELIRWRREAGNEIASIEDIAKKYPDEPLVIALSKEYFSATSSDINKAKSILASPDNLVIISTGSHKTDSQVENLLPCDARFQTQFHCCRAEINIRLLAVIVKTHKPSQISISKLWERYKRKLSRLPKIKSPKRIRVHDKELARLITAHLRQLPQSAYSTVLRKLRSKNIACEQKRFRRVFKKIKTKTQANQPPK